MKMAKPSRAATNELDAESRQMHLLPRRAPGPTEQRAGSVSLVATWALQVATLAGVILVYLRAHHIDVMAWLRGDPGPNLAPFDFIGGNRSVGGIIEILFWTCISTTMVYMRLTLTQWRRNNLNPVQHVVEWLNGAVSNPIVAAVIVWAFRSPRIGLGQAPDISLEMANVDFYIVLGFVLGYFDPVRRSFINWIRGRGVDNLTQKIDRANHQNKNSDGEDATGKLQVARTKLETPEHNPIIAVQNVNSEMKKGATNGPVETSHGA